MSRKFKFRNPEVMSLSKCALFLFFTFNFSLFTFHLGAQGLTKYGESTSTSTNFVDKNGKIGNSPALNKNGKILTFSCGGTLAITHTAGTVAPVTKTVNYGTVTSSLSGTSKCWITQNLGSDGQATSATDNTEASAGWYWQFNRKQGYKHDGTTRTPNATWITPISETSDWLAANDPCTIELGAGWRIPTSTEWYNADINGQTGGWDNYTETFDDVLKLHAAGYLSDGSLSGRGTYGMYWSSTQNDATNGWSLRFYNTVSAVEGFAKTFGFPLRCLKD